MQEVEEEETGQVVAKEAVVQEVVVMEMTDTVVQGMLEQPTQEEGLEAMLLALLALLVDQA
jgi:hypothetical protein